MENKLLKFFKKISTFENGNTTLKDWSKGGLEPTLLILLWKPVLHVRGEVRFWRAGTGHVRGGGGSMILWNQYRQKVGSNLLLNSLRSRFEAKLNLMDSDSGSISGFRRVHLSTKNWRKARKLQITATLPSVSKINWHKLHCFLLLINHLGFQQLKKTFHVFFLQIWIS